MWGSVGVSGVFGTALALGLFRSCGFFFRVRFWFFPSRSFLPPEEAKIEV